MICERCGGTVGGITVKVGPVKMTTVHCPHCGALYRTKKVSIQFSVAAFMEEIEKLNAQYKAPRPTRVRVAIEYLQAKIDSHAASQLSKEDGIRRRRNDLWERKYLRELIGDSDGDG